MPPKGRPSSSHSSSSRSRSSSSRSSSHRSSSSSYRPRSSHSSHRSYHSRPTRTYHSSYDRYSEPRTFSSAHSSWTDNRYSDSYNDFDYYSDDFEERQANRDSSRLTVMIIAVMILVFSIILSKASINNTYGKKETHRLLYVSELGRDVNWSYEYDSYYDPQTDCYFFLNTDLEPEIWQYWFEGISSDYGNYGWMEYDYEEKQWYIQTGKYTWDVLPSKYKNDPHLWHFNE